MAAARLAERKAGFIDALMENDHLGHARGVVVFDDEHWDVLVADPLTRAELSDRLVEIAFELTGQRVEKADLSV